MATVATLQNRVSRVSTEFASLDAAVAALGANDAVLTLAPGDTKTLTANLTIPANVALQGQMGVIATNGFTLTINGPIHAGNFQMFDVSGGGSVVLSGAAEHVRPEWFGAQADNASDNATELAATIATAKASGVGIQLSKGRYRFGTALSFVDVPFVRGVREETFLVPTAAVASPCISIATTDQLATGYPRLSHFADFEVLGTLTSGVVGVLVGDASESATSGDIVFDRVMVSYFEDAGGVGMQVADVVHPVFNECRFTRSETNVLHAATSAALPTLPAYNGCYINYAAGVGVRIEGGYRAAFNGCVIEANGDEAVQIVTAPGRVVRGVLFNQVWFEVNWQSLAGTPASRAAEFAITADGSVGSVRGVEFRGCRWGEDCKAFELTTVLNAVLDAPDREGALAGDFSVQGASILHVSNFTEGATSLFSIASTAIVRLNGWRWKDQAITPGSIAAGARYSTSFTFTGTKLGDRILVTAPVDTNDLQLWGYVHAADGVTVCIENPTAGAIDPGTVTVRVWNARFDIA